VIMPTVPIESEGLPEVIPTPHRRLTASLRWAGCGAPAYLDA